MQAARRRVFVVEDEPVLLIDLKRRLESLGYDVTTASRVDPALRGARELEFDVALLDANIGGESIAPVAAAIADRGCPIIFISGYGAAFVPQVEGSIMLEKPCSTAQLRQALLAATTLRTDA